MSRRRIFVAGWSGAGNLGDELLLKALRRRVESVDADLVVSSANPDETRRLHGVDAVGAFDLRGTWQTLAEADAMIFGPGGIIQDQTSVFSLPSHLWRVIAARRQSVPTIGFGLGAVPMEWRLSKRALRRSLRDVPLVVRDQESAAVLADCGLVGAEVTADLVFGLEHTSEAGDRVVVAPRPFSPGRLLPSGTRERRRPDPRVGSLANAIDETAGRLGLPVHFVAFQPERDQPFIDEIADRLTVNVTSSCPGMEHVTEEIGSSQVVIAMRYHAAVTAVACGRPSVLIGYSPKVSALAGVVGRGAAHIADEPSAYSQIGRSAELVLGQEEAVIAASADLRNREHRNGAILERFFSDAARRRR